MQTYIEKLSSNFLVAALVPSLAFVTIVMVIFGPIIPPQLAERLMGTFNPLGEEGVLVLALTVIMGFTLSSLNTSIYRILEGYNLLARFPETRQFQRDKVQRLQRQLIEVEKKIRKLEKKKKGKDDARLQELEDQRYYLASELDLRFPPAEPAILPTRFGNILRAAETYPGLRYGIDAVRLWPRLVHVIPKEYYDKIEQSNNGLAFVVNCAVLSLFLGILSGLAAGYECLVCWYAYLGKDEILYFILVEPKFVDIYFQRIFIYLVICALGFIVSWFFYRASFPIAMQYGNMIRSSFDLFRFDLLHQLKLTLPEDSDTEYELWQKVSEFIATGTRLGPLHFEYQIATDNSGTETSG
jgi:hypothetical protein